VAVARLGGEQGYSVTICDAREPFVASARFSEVADVVVSWPDEYLQTQVLGPRDAILVFAHDRKFDEPALAAAVRTEAGYIGALGSRRTHRERVARLRELGATDEELDRISGPCGLDIGAATPPQTAVSILAEIIAAGAGRGGGRLSESSGPIRRQAQADLVRLDGSNRSRG
jgi:xanthine dehydrogenase accessory factor